MLDIYAGRAALEKIQGQGFKQELFTSFYGASGGPKWFTLFGLDKLIFGEFFKDRTTRLNLLGSSAGAFRAACFAQKDPVAAITRMAESYSQTVYSKKAKADEITAKAKEIIDYTMAGHGVDEILANEVIKTHFLVNKVSGLAGCENKLCQSLGLIKSIVLNRFDRKLLASQYQRYVFKSPSSHLAIKDYCGFTTEYVDLSVSNFKQALLASGSIPMIMQGVRDIPQATKGMYRDGGIVDYHFDIDIANRDGLTLYPHFNARPKAGWFDKSLNRDVQSYNYDNVVMLVPSDEFVQSLPFGKIPDRTDFTTMDAKPRIKYWQSVLAQTERLAESFDDFINKQALENIKLF